MSANPYPGLRPFEVHQYESFFGRDRQIDELLLRLNEHRFVAVVGLSGSGKSSLVKAGLVHRLEVGHLTSAGSDWATAVFRPGSDPIEALAGALDAALEPVVGRAESLLNSTQELLHGTRGGRPPGRNLLLVVDQFEEIFRFQRERHLSARTAAHFVDLLLAVDQDLSSDYRVYVVLTMRSDALGEAAQFEGLPEVLNRCQDPVPRMTSDQLREAVEGPAALTDTRVAPDLLQRLLTEAGQGQDALPLLQHLLWRLWDRRQPAIDGWFDITFKHYEELGGAARALNDHADEVLKSLPLSLQDVARRVFQQLTEVTDGREQRRPTRLSRLATLTGAPLIDVTAVAVRFYDAGLVTSPDRARMSDWEVDITHECLIRQWNSLRAWAKAEMSDRDEFREFARRAERSGGTALLTGSDLVLATRLLEQGHTPAWAERHGGDLGKTVDFIEKSRRKAIEAEALEEQVREQRRRRSMIIAGVGIAVAVVVGLLGLYALRLRQTALDERAVAVNERKKADELRQVAESRFEEALRSEQLAMSAKRQAHDAQLEAEMQRDAAEKGQREVRRQTLLSKLESLPRYATDAPPSEIDERIALLTREAYLLHALVPDEPRGLIEQALVKVTSRGAFSSGLFGHTRGVLSVAFSPDSKRLASASADNSIRLWDLQNRETPPRVLGGQGRGESSGGAQGRGDRPAGEGQDRGHTDEVNVVVFSRDGHLLASGSDDGTARVWDLATGSQPVVLAHPAKSAVFSVAFSPDGSRLATGTIDGKVHLWNLKQQPVGSPLEFDAESKGAVRSLGFLRGGTQLAAIGQGAKGIKVWDLANPALPASTLFGAEESLGGFALSADGFSLVASVGNGPLRVWNLRDPAAAAVEIALGFATAFALSADGRLVATTDGEAFQIWDLSQPAEPILDVPTDGFTAALAFSPDGSKVASGGSSNTVHVWDVPAVRNSNVLRGHTDWVKTVAFSPDGARLASGADDSTIIVWDLRKKSQLLTLATGEPVIALAFSPDGSRLASNGVDQTVRIWETANLSKSPHLLAAGADALSLAFSSDSSRLAVGGSDNEIRVFNLKDFSAAPVVLSRHSEAVLALAFSRDGTRLASGSADGQVLVWDPRRSGDPLQTFAGHDGEVNTVALSPDGNFVASGADDDTVRLWPLDGRSQARVLEGHDAGVFSVVFSPDGTRLASGGWDATVRLSGVDRSTALVVLDSFTDDINVGGLLTTGHELAVGSDDNLVHLVDLWIGAAERICSMVKRNLSLDEWRTYVGIGEYRRTCPALPPGLGAPTGR